MLFWIHIFTLYFKNINHFAHTLDKIYLKKTLLNYGFKKKKILSAEVYKFEILQYVHNDTEWKWRQQKFVSGTL